MKNALRFLCDLAALREILLKNFVKITKILGAID